jgi:hypothetical protein
MTMTIDELMCRYIGGGFFHQQNHPTDRPTTRFVRAEYREGLEVGRWYELERFAVPGCYGETNYLYRPVMQEQEDEFVGCNYVPEAR